MQIPKQLRVGSKLYTVSRVRNMSRRFLRGLAEFQEKRIQIARNSSDMARRYTPAEQEETFWHELTHAILEDMNHPLYDNEPFVERFSKRLSRAVRTAKF
jgi:hypothetical protein